MIERGVNSPLTSSMGRLFDSVAAIVGIADDARYEGEAAILLEAAADPSARGQLRVRPPRVAADRALADNSTAAHRRPDAGAVGDPRRSSQVEYPLG